eukprot:CAMPEP_0197828944 /NCGR_PEP_ID=MMETSP1437-20131217/5436_1 /TAXON_ID=49252 ORGANISM="Eucampia antarctica, Strain CCMP1452" /NCGR_SAMPLE_ID=MMETSP1437 /ASSEMBLY_ACC=CAM_ASM_001096 /LENGTH=203 /DNA_ID=CAMNT_0043430371 /DNA_START=258 /DNA_END=869 /DNA_ORIENTATION=+
MTAAPVEEEKKINGGGRSLTNVVASLWSVTGVMMILLKSVKRIAPIAMEPFQGGTFAPLTPFQLGSYTAMCLWFAYVEGYKGFQTKFSPLVVARSFTLYGAGKNANTPIHHVLLGPFYAMGLFHSTKKRKIISWSVTIGVAMIVALVKKLPYPWRNIVDAGVVVGLTWGTCSIGLEWIKAMWTGNNPTIDPALPSSDQTTKQQ